MKLKIYHICISNNVAIWYLFLDRKYREVCWDINKRGTVGENILHICVLLSTAIHADLAKRLIKEYPKLINDIYLSDEYYGMSKNWLSPLFSKLYFGKGR